MKVLLPLVNLKSKLWDNQMNFEENNHMSFQLLLLFLFFWLVSSYHFPESHQHWHPTPQRVVCTYLNSFLGFLVFFPFFYPSSHPSLWKIIDTFLLSLISLCFAYQNISLPMLAGNVFFVISLCRNNKERSRSTKGNSYILQLSLECIPTNSHVTLLANQGESVSKSQIYV